MSLRTKVKATNGSTKLPVLLVFGKFPLFYFKQ